ncbi:flagellar filament capping protein FliD [Pelotomaculum isophthalicicum JI]|uniref:Flagellar hook-associated protein 2 n=1 Tax=Pelotomaculum isophthalicicum JI TaxID=947010 RepID=A0A9X4H8R9_9FIRM|nr:flagellar filament capping protein FliD [Pelotomaculum isophthalicicum]MDF9409139.1 flagellar filament capping protein FliD [Pelotomaculum isophthalicicum JI]
MAGIQIGGIVSGFDTQSLITALTENDKKPLTLMQDKKDRLAATQSAWKDVNTRLTNLRSTVTQLKMSATFNSKTATSGDEKVFTASASTSAAAGSYQIKVNKLAEYNRYASSSAATITGNSSATSSTALGLTGGFTFKSADSTSTGSITVTSTDTLSSIQQKINNANAGVTASIVENSLVIKSNTMGAKGQITLTDAGGGTAFTDLGLTQTTAAQDAEIVYEGMTITRGTNSISDVISGVTLNLVGVSTTNVSLTVATDTTKASDAIKAFVEQYNSLMDFIAEKTAVDPQDTLSTRDSTDLTPYDANRKRGELQGDPTIISLVSQIRTMVSKNVAGLNPVLSALSAIGVTTSYYSGDGEKQLATLVINDAKLQQALADAPGSASVTGRGETPVKYNSFISKTAAGITGNTSATATTVLNLTGSFTVKSSDSSTTASVTVLATDSLTSIMNKINAGSAGVTASIVDNKLQVTSNTMGTPGQVVLTDTGGGTAFTDLGFAVDTAVSSADNAIQSGQSGRLIVEIDGKDYNIQFSGPKTSQQVVDDINTVIGSVATASINSDNRLVITNRSTGVNSVIRIKQIMEDHAGDLAKLGLTQGDSGRGKDLAALFTAQVSETQGTITSFSALGSTPVTSSGTLGLRIDGTDYYVAFTGAYNSSDAVSKINNVIGSAGQAYLDSNNCLVIRSLKSGTSSSVQVTRIDAGLTGLNLAVGEYGAGAKGVTGLAITLDNYYASYVASGGILSRKQQSLTDQMNDIQDQMDALNARIKEKEDRLWQMFSDMETKLQKLQAQSQTLSSYLGLLTSSSSSSSSS